MKLFLPLVFLLLALFAFYPELDLAFSRAVYTHYEGFLPKRDGIPGFFYILTRVFAWGCAVGLIGYMAYYYFRNKSFHKPAIFLLITLTLGPGIIVHTGFKDNWDRARPGHITEFGGTKNYTPPLVPADQCVDNCSFTSGHAAMAFYLMVFAFIMKHPLYRRLLLSSGIIFGLLIGWVRIIQGGHFLSDVLFSGLIVYATAWVVYWGMFRRKGLNPH